MTFKNITLDLRDTLKVGRFPVIFSNSCVCGKTTRTQFTSIICICDGPLIFAIHRVLWIPCLSSHLKKIKNKYIYIVPTLLELQLVMRICPWTRCACLCLLPLCSGNMHGTSHHILLPTLENIWAGDIHDKSSRKGTEMFISILISYDSSTGPSSLPNLRIRFLLHV